MELKELLKKDMTLGEKVEHIWEYYKIHIIGIVVGIIIVFSFLNIWVFNPPAKNGLDISVRAGYMESDVGVKLADELNPLIIEEGANETVMVEHLPVGQDMDPQMTMASEAKFIGKIEVGEMDILIMNEIAYQQGLLQGIYVDLNEFETQYGIKIDDSLEVTGEMFEASEDAQGVEGVYALDVNKMPKLHELVGYTAEQHYLGIFINSERLDRAAEAIEYLME